MKKFLLFILICLYPALCRAQDTGCFEAGKNNDAELTTNINFNRYNAFFVGEFHGIYSTPGIKLALIKYLNRECGVSDVFMEIGFSAAWLYNRYLQTGDTALFTNPVLTYAHKKVNRDFWKQLYEYNKILGHKITIHGMDFERKDFVKALRLLMPPGKERPKEIMATLTFIDTAVNVVVNLPDFGDAKKSKTDAPVTAYEMIRNDVIQNRGIYERYYGADFSIVADIMLNKDTYNSFRNEAMYNNVTVQIKRGGIKKFIVFSGLMHGNMSDAGKGSLCYRLAKNSRFKKKFVNIAMACKNCYDSQAQQKYQTLYRGPYTYGADTLLMSSIYRQHFNHSCKYTMIPADAVKDKRVKEFSDYLILIKDQPVF